MRLGGTSGEQSWLPARKNHRCSRFGGMEAPTTFSCTDEDSHAQTSSKQEGGARRPFFLSYGLGDNRSGLSHQRSSSRTTRGWERAVGGGA